MKAIQMSGPGGSEVLEYNNVQDPVPGSGEVLIQLRAIGVNYMDIYIRSGVYPIPSLPLIPGSEGAGEVLEVGDDVSGFKQGDVVAYTGVSQSYAQKIVWPPWKLIKIPTGVDVDIAASVMLQGITAQYLCKSTYPLGSGDTCLIHASAGGVGLLLTQMAKSLGATVIGTVSTEEKGNISRSAGADYVINYKTHDFQKEVEAISDGKGIQVVYDSVGLDTFDKSIGCLATRGYMVLYGQSSGLVPPISPMLLNSKSLLLTRPTLTSYIDNREELENRASEVLNAVNEGELKVRIHNKLPLADAALAHEQLEGRLTTGKLLLVP